MTDTVAALIPETPEPQNQPSETSNACSMTNVSQTAEIANSAPADAPQQTADETPLMSDRAVLALARMMAVDAELTGHDTPAEVERKLAVIEEAIYGRDESPTFDRSYELPEFEQAAMERHDHQTLLQAAAAEGLPWSADGDDDLDDDGVYWDADLELADEDDDDEPEYRECEVCHGSGSIPVDGGGRPCSKCEGYGSYAVEDDEPVTSIMAQEITLPGEPVPAQVTPELPPLPGPVLIGPDGIASQYVEGGWVDLPVKIGDAPVKIETIPDRLAELARRVSDMNTQINQLTSERDAALQAKAVAIDAGRQHKDALRQLQAKVKEAIAAGDLTLLKD